MSVRAARDDLAGETMGSVFTLSARVVSKIVGSLLGSYLLSPNAFRFVIDAEESEAFIRAAPLAAAKS